MSDKIPVRHRVLIADDDAAIRQRLNVDKPEGTQVGRH
jgi:hypothetical protein